MNFLEAIRAMRTSRARPSRMRDMPMTSSAAACIREPEGGSDQPREGKDYNNVAKSLLAKIEGRQKLSSREFRDLAWCLWVTKPALAERPGAIVAIVRETEMSARRQPFRSLASSFVTSFDPEMAGINEISGVLSRVAPSKGRPWANLHASFQLFNKDDGPRNVARASINEQTAPTAILKEGGLGVFDSQSGYAKACAGAALQQLANGIEKDALKRLTLVRKLALGANGRLLFEDHAPFVATALLKPFNATMPEKEVRDPILAMLIPLFGDPRISAVRWTRMKEAEDIVRRWLTEQSLRQFLDVVDKVAVEHMWKYRRAFWEGVYRLNLISEAWVVFDHAGAYEARRAFGKEIKFADFDGGVQRGHAVLLLRIGRGMVAEWSHSGKCIIWNEAEESSAPRLYRPKYAPHALRNPGDASDNIHGSIFAASHHGSDNYAWQGKVAAKIHQMTGRRIPPSGYAVR
jgi:EH_Signature domain